MIVRAHHEVFEFHAVELFELVEHHGARGHVDAEREGLGAEKQLDEARREQPFHDFLCRRQYAGVMIRAARFPKAPHGEKPVIAAEAVLGRQIAYQVVGLFPFLLVKKVQVLVKISVAFASPAVKAEVQYRIIAAVKHILDDPF